METRRYESELATMHKAVYEVKDLAQLEKLAAQLTTKGVRHYLWREQPENILTALATRPYPRSIVRAVCRNLRLYK